MPRVNRSEIFANDEIHVFHLINRCVRREPQVPVTLTGKIERHIPQLTLPGTVPRENHEHVSYCESCSTSSAASVRNSVPNFQLPIPKPFQTLKCCLSPGQDYSPERSPLFEDQTGQSDGLLPRVLLESHFAHREIECRRWCPAETLFQFQTSFKSSLRRSLWEIRQRAEELICSNLVAISIKRRFRRVNGQKNDLGSSVAKFCWYCNHIGELFVNLSNGDHSQSP